MVYNPNKLAIHLGITAGVALSAGFLALGSRAPQTDEVPQPLPTSTACVNTANPQWCEIQEGLKGVLGESSAG